MSIFLVDYENTHSLTGIESLNKQDKVIIFYSQNANSLTFDTHKKIMESPATVEYKYVGTGSQNALDFQLSTYLGYLLSTQKNDGQKIVIVSRDKGFNNIVTFWKQELAVEIQIVPNLAIDETKPNNSEKVESQAAATVAQTEEENTAQNRQEVATTVDGQQAEQSFSADGNSTNTETSKSTVNYQQNVEVASERKIAPKQTKPQRKNAPNNRGKQPNNVTINTQDIAARLKNSEAELSDEEINAISQIVVKYKTKATVNNHINKLLKDSAKSGAILKIIKPFINK